MSDLAATVREILSQMPAQLNVGAAQGVKAVIQISLSGDGGGDWYVEIKDGACAVTEGTHASPNMTMSVPLARRKSMHAWP